MPFVEQVSTPDPEMIKEVLEHDEGPSERESDGDVGPTRWASLAGRPSTSSAIRRTNRHASLSARSADDHRCARAGVGRSSWAERVNVATAFGLFVLALGVGTYGSIIGAGGGFLMVAGLVLVFDLTGATAVGTSIVTTLFIQLVGAYTYDRRGLVDRPTAGWFAVGSVPVALLSAIFVADRIPERTFEAVIGVMLLALALFVVFVPSPNAAAGTTHEPRRGTLAASGGVIGVLSGALGVGSGLVTVPLLGWVQQLSAHRAAATTTLIGALSGLAAAAGHTIAGNPRWDHLPYLIAGAVLGGRLGASSAGRLGERVVLALLAGGLVVAGVPLVIRAI